MYLAGMLLINSSYIRICFILYYARVCGVLKGKYCCLRRERETGCFIAIDYRDLNILVWKREGVVKNLKEALQLNIKRRLTNR